MTSWLRRRMVRARILALGPVLARLDAIEAAQSSRLEHLARRLDDIDAMIQVFDGRVSTVGEKAAAQLESQARLARRVDAIEKLLTVPSSSTPEPG